MIIIIIIIIPSPGTKTWHSYSQDKISRKPSMKVIQVLAL